MTIRSGTWLPPAHPAHRGWLEEACCFLETPRRAPPPRLTPPSSPPAWGPTELTPPFQKPIIIPSAFTLLTLLAPSPNLRISITCLSFNSPGSFQRTPELPEGPVSPVLVPYLLCFSGFPVRMSVTMNVSNLPRIQGQGASSCTLS